MRSSTTVNEKPPEVKKTKGAHIFCVFSPTISQLLSRSRTLTWLARAVLWLACLPVKQTREGGASGVIREKKKRSCQTPTIAWNITRAVPNKYRTLPWKSGSEMIFREELLDYDIFVKGKKKDLFFFLVGVCGSVGLRAGQREFCWQTSQLAVLLLLTESCVCCAANFTLFRVSSFRIVCLQLYIKKKKRFRPKEEETSKMNTGMWVHTTSSYVLNFAFSLFLRTLFCFSLWSKSCANLLIHVCSF